MNHRIIIVTDHMVNQATGHLFEGGEQRVYREIARLARAKGFQFVVIQESTEPRVWQLKNGIEVHGGTRERWWGRISRGQWARRMIADLPSFNGQTTIVGSYASHLVALSAHRPWLYQHGVHWDGGSASQQHRDVKLLKTLLPRLGGLICVDANFPNVMASHMTRSELAHIFQRTHVIPNFQGMRPKPLPAVGPEGIRFLFPRNFVEGRGIWNVTEACVRLWAKGWNFHLTLCGRSLPGRSKESKRLEEELTRGLSEGKVNFVQRPFDEMHEEYARCHVVLVPTISSEGTSLSCLEAFGCGRPVIGTWIGGLQMLLQDGINGYCIAPTADALAEAMEHLIENRQTLEILRVGALETAQHFSQERWEARINQWLDQLVTVDA